ncbi:MAG: hypothetical protein AAFW69_07595 [Pseudomonadota bacterium]
MSPLVIAGTLVTLLGIAGLFYCIREARAVRAPEVGEEERRRRLVRLVGINMGAVALAFLGLGLVVLGLVI